MTSARLPSMEIRKARTRWWQAVEGCKILVFVSLSGKCQDLDAKQSISIAVMAVCDLLVLIKFINRTRAKCENAGIF